MADEKKLDVDMEEYSIPDEGGGGTTSGYGEQMASATEGALKKPGRGKRLLIPVILVVAILVFYQILSWFSHQAGQKGLKEEQEIARKTQQSMVAAQTKAVEESSSAAEVTIPSPAVHQTTATAPVTSSTYNQDVQNKLEILATRTESNTQQLEKLQSGLLRSQAALVALNHTMIDLSASLQDTTKQVQELNALKPKPKPVKRVVKPAPPQEVYHVKAIVPGLAWLESSRGKTVSIRVGDSLAGYGVVQVISPQQGMVITSDGTVIQYGVNDF